MEEELMTPFADLSLEEKRKEFGWEITEMQLMLDTLIKELAPDYQPKDQSEYDNLFDATTSEEEYLTGLYDDVMELKDTLATYCEVVTSAYYEDGETEE